MPFKAKPASFEAIRPSEQIKLTPTFYWSPVGLFEGELTYRTRRGEGAF